MTFDYLDGRDENAKSRIFNGEALSKFQRADNDNKRETVSMIANPGKALCDAVIENDLLKFTMVLGHARNTGSNLNKAYCFSVAYERADMMKAIHHRIAQLDTRSMLIAQQERANGRLMGGVIRGDISSVRVSLNNDSIDVNCHGGECFKLAILGNHIKIADMLHGKGIDTVAIYEDEDFMDKVNKCEGGVTREGRQYVFQVIGNYDRKPMMEHEPIGP